MTNTPEQYPNPAETPNKQDALAAFSKFAAMVGDPAELDLNDPDVIEANRSHDAWMSQVELEAKLAGTDEARLLMEVELTTFNVDAGFRGADYLDTVANDWLAQTLWEAQDGDMIDVATKIQAKIDSINQIIGQEGL